METAVYFFAAFLLVAVAWVVFRIFVRRDYLQKGHLTLFTSFLELIIWALYLGFPYLYNPPEWVAFWSPEAPVNTPVRIVGVVCIVVGLALAFGTMFWFGLRRAFGVQVDGLIQSGLYRVTRNPQLMAGILLVAGPAILWPSWYAVGWVVLFVVISHLMVITEEEHLLAVFGEEYERYCDQVPRYIGVRQRK